MGVGNGPFLNAAMICEKVLQEQDGVVSAVRVIDRVFFVLLPDGSPQFPQHPVTFYISLKSGSARGRYSIEVERQKPSGETSAVFALPVLFEGEERGVNIIVSAVFAPDQEGLYWFDIYFADPSDEAAGQRLLLTRVPLRAIYQPVPTIGPPG